MNTKELLTSVQDHLGLPSNLTFLTGSQAFGTNHAESDYDICVPIHLAEEAKAKAALPTPSAYNNGWMFELQGKSINIIPLHPLDMLCWYLATQEIARLCRLAGMQAKFSNIETRHGMFEILRGFYKTALPYEGAKVSYDVLRSLMETSPAVYPMQTAASDDDDIPW
jgi:hypothetical protein